MHVLYCVEPLQKVLYNHMGWVIYVIITTSVRVTIRVKDGVGVNGGALRLWFRFGFKIRTMKRC